MSQLLVGSSQQDLSGYVPYVGATADLDLGLFNITAANLSGTNTGDQDLSGLVPYTGATADVDLGTYNISTTGIGEFGYGSTIGGTNSYIKVEEINAGSTYIPYIRGYCDIGIGLVIPYATAFDVIITKENAFLGVDPAVAFLDDSLNILSSINHDIDGERFNIFSTKNIHIGGDADDVDVYIDDYGSSGGNLIVYGYIEVGGYLRGLDTYLAINSADTFYPTGEGKRLMWIEDKSAFRVGSLVGASYADNWSALNIGTRSICIGTNGKADSTDSIAIGIDANALASSAMAIGNSATVSGSQGYAFGRGITSSGDNCMAIGMEFTNSVDNSIALGITSKVLEILSTGVNITGILTTGSATDYWSFSELDFGMLGNIPLLSATSSFALGSTIGAIADYLVIYDNSGSGTVTLAFSMNGLASIATLVYDGLTFLADASFLPGSSDSYDLGAQYNEWKNLWLTGVININGTELATTSLEYLEGLDQYLTTTSDVEFHDITTNAIYMDAAATGTQFFAQIAGSTVWQIDYLATVMNISNVALGDNVLQLQQDGDAVLYKTLWVENGKIGIGYDGTSAISAGLQMNHIDGILSMGTLDSGYTGFKDAVTAMQWLPRYGALFVGRCSNGTSWDTVGKYAFSAGIDNKAEGQCSVALGQVNNATANFTVGIGYNNTASNAYSYAIGTDNTASNTNAFAFGDECEASGGPSMALGFTCVASAGHTIAIGNTATSSHTRSIVISAGTAYASSDTTNQLKLASQYVDLVPITYVRIGDLTNYSRFSPNGDLAFVGTAGLYPRTLTQSAEPAAGTGATQLDTGEMCVWIDSDDSKCYYCYNQGGTVKTVELT